MIAALFALAAAMVIGGCAAVIQGFPYVRLESGLAMVIAGSVAASSGAVLFGLGVLTLAFRKVERAIGRNPAVRAPEADAGSAHEGRTRLPPVLPAAPAFLVPPVVEPPFDPDRSRLDPSLEPRVDGPREPVSAPARSPSSPSASPQPASSPSTSSMPVLTKPLRTEPELPVPAPVARDPVGEARPEASMPPSAIASDDDLFAAPEGQPGSKAPPLRSSLDPVPDPTPKPVTRTVVGRYASGGNTYVMFEDGSIEAETPQGRFTFASLDELKAFVDGGGEAGTRGAA
ncbi:MULTISPECIES: hypothetical protein [Methylobacterium]|uniref:DUF308 domain-containing protein n=1 Tax=Methylobacterium longum TaxID=767694 RepID=A0ABT8AU33_9HYPH|nr:MULTISPECIES: hypothetical protein [Methylobacterium]MCJ2099069.1 hypothetical protein [Methylobacterium sp. E-046]MDN3572849.1 hypothetical protein [Methylobacterium longum]GJE10025.1 hypothetical protein FOHLNKBM_1055 [Methylobacterium longum]